MNILESMDFKVNKWKN